MFKSIDVGAMPLEEMIGREWLATNGIGGYASSTIPCLNTRKYHGLLVAAMAAPVRRMVLLSRVEEAVHCDGWPHPLSSNEYPGKIHPEGYRALCAFNSEPFPRWAFQGENWTLQKELCLLSGQNTVCLTYTLLAGNRPVTLELNPVFALRTIHELSFQWNGRLVAESRGKGEQKVPATTRTPEVFFAHTGSFESRPNWYLNTVYRCDQERGYAGLEDVWSPGAVRFSLSAGQSAHFVCSADPFDLNSAIEQAQQQGTTTSRYVTPTSVVAAEAIAAVECISGFETVDRGATRDEILIDLTRAAGQFVVRTAPENAADAASAVIANYPWSAPSGRAGLAGFSGLFLVTGRFQEGRSLLLTMASKIDRGLMPSEFPETGSAPLYHGADVSLWFVNAAFAYLRYTGDQTTFAAQLLDPMLQVIEHYRRGTRLGISTDSDGLLKTHEPAIATTWMDAKVGDWVVTPRQGRPVEINALWFNAVAIAAELASRFGRVAAADDLAALSRLVKRAFNERFWNKAAQCCYDVVGDRGADPAVRPNQLLALSLPFPVLSIDRQPAVLERILRELRTPVGVRTISPQDSSYVGRYAGNVISRDRAVHGGSAFPWLLGPLATAYVRVHGRGDGARREAGELLRGCIAHLRGDGLGQLPELFDGDAPQTPGSAIASALSVAEILRAYCEDVLDRLPNHHVSPSMPIAETEAAVRPIPSTPRG